MKYAIALLIIVVSLSGCENEPEYEIKYEVKGSTPSVSLTYENKTGGTNQEDAVNLPWTYSFTAGAGVFLYVSAQNEDSVGTVTATVYRDGSVVETATSAVTTIIC